MNTETSDSAALQSDYLSTLELIKLLSDIRFRCLVFVTAVIAVTNALLPGTGHAGARIALGLVGFVATLGIAVYELRNSQLYEAAVHRAKHLELLRNMPRASAQIPTGGLFNERPDYVDKRWTVAKAGDAIPLMRFWLIPVKHDRGLGLIYSAALGGWAYLVAAGVVSLARSQGLWSGAPLDGRSTVIAALIGATAFAITLREFLRHDSSRFRPGPIGDVTK